MDEVTSTPEACPLADRISLNAAEAAVLLGVSDKLVYTWMKEYPDFPAVKIGGRRLISRSLLQAWFEKQLQSQGGVSIG